MKFLSPEVALYLYKATIRPCMEYCCHVWSGAPSSYLELLGKLQKSICRTLLVLHLLPLLNSWLIVKMYSTYIFSIRITLVDIHLNRLNRFHFLILKGGLLVILIDCINSLPPFLDVTRMSMSTVSFLVKLNLEFSAYGMLSFDYDLSGFKSRINRHLLIVSSF